MATIDTLQDAVNTLTSSTTELLDEVSTSKTDLNNAKAGAEDARDTALTHKTGAETAKTGAEAARDLAYSYQQSAASAVAYQDLAAISTDITDTAVDVFVYDTRKDSDGGAWRKRTQHTSWYNETLNTSTRGSRKEFPAVAVIVAESDQVTIYDGDDPSMPMWKSVTSSLTSGTQYNFLGSGSLSSVCMVNGVLFVGRFSLLAADFIKDEMNYGTKGIRHDFKGVGLSDWAVQQSGLPSSGVAGSPSIITGFIVYNTINDVAMTVLPNAPIDAATGLPVPTIAVATDGGVSVIKDDGTVVSGGELNSGWKVTGLFFDGDATLWATEGTTYSGLQRMSVPPFSSVEVIGSPTNGGYGYPYYNPSTANTYGAPQNAPKLRQGGWLYGKAMSAFGNMFAAGNTAGISKVLHNSASQLTSLVNYTTSTYNTGWMNGNIKLATLSDTDDTDVTGSELVTNGTFDTDISGWTASDAGCSLSLASNQLRITNNDASAGGAVTSFSVVSGKTYTFSVGTSSKDVWLYLGASANTATYFGPVVSNSHTWTSTVTGTVYFMVKNSVATNGDTIDIDNISVRLAEEDRSVNGNGLQVFGTVTKNPVATGADLVAYSGFGASNYLQQPYNSDLDFGTGDFCVMGWIKTPSGDNGTLLDRPPLMIRQTSSGISIRIVSGEEAVSSSDVPNGQFRFVTGLRRSGVLEIYVDGVLKNTDTSTSSVDGTLPVTTLGIRGDGFWGDATVALIRVSATAPSAEQIAKIYEDEKVLFQENAKATLYGSSDAVTALAYDDDTNLLHVGTSSGRSDFNGLRRVNNTTDAVTEAISASNGLIAED